MSQSTPQKTGKSSPYQVSEELYQALFQQAADGIFIANKQGHCIEVNQRGCEMLGYTRQELLNLTIQDLIPDEDRESDPVQFDELRTGIPLLKERRLRCKDGRLLPVEISARMLEDGSFLGMVRDISKRKQAEEALQESERRYRDIFDNVLDGLYLLEVTKDGRFRNLEINPALEQATGIPRNLVLGKTQEECVPEETARKVNEKYRRCVEAGRPIEEEVELDLPSGQRSFHSTLIPVRNDNGSIYRIIGISRDITERKEVEKKLRDTAEELQRVLASVSDYLWSGEIDEEGNWAYNYYSPVVETITGRPPEFYMDDPQRWLSTVHPDDQPRVLDAFLNLKSGQSEREEDEYRIVHSDGTIRWVRDSATITRLESGRLRINGVVSDITGRKQAEEALQRSHEELRVFFSQTIDGCFFMMLDEPVRWDETTDKEAVLDYVFAHQHITKINEAMLAQYGATREQMLKLTPNDFFQHNLAHGRDLWRQLFDAGKVRLVSDERKLDGTSMWIEGEYILLYDAEGHITGHFGIQRDISKRRQTEEQLHESNERFRLLAESSLTGIYLIQDSLFRYANPSLARIFGYKVEEVINKLGPMELVYPDDRPLVAENLRRRIQGEEESIHYDFRGLRKDGSMIYVEVHGRRIKFGGEAGVIGSLVDITERKQAEAERQAHLRFLESLDKINRAIQGTNDLEKMMRDVLDILLTIFDCDRAWLAYPCDPEAASWQVPMERTRPEYPGVLPIGVNLPLDPVGAAVFRILKAANSPVQFGPESEHPVPVEMAQGFNIQSFIAMALYPMVGQPWSFGLDQCNHPRVWTPEDQRLFQEIGRRLADALASLLAYRDLRQSERRLAKAERIAHVGWWDRDYETDGIALSDEASRIFGMPLEEQNQDDLARWHKRWQELIHPEDRPGVAQAAEAALQGGPRYDVEYRVIRPNGQVRFVRSQGDVTWDESGRPQRMFGIMQDITELRQVEDELRRNREAALKFSEQLATLQEVTHQLSKAESSDDLCRQAVQLGRSRLGFDRVSIWFIEEDLGIMRGSFGTDEYGQVRDERNAKIKFRRAGLAWRVFSQKDSNALIEHHPLYDHEGRKVGEGDNAIAALWDGDEVIGVISVDNLFTQQLITKHQLEVLRLYATTLGHLIRRKRAEEALTLFRTLADHTNDAIEVIDPETGRFLDANEPAYLALGYTREEFLSLTVPEINPLVSVRSWQETIDELQRSGSFVRESQHQHKDGSVFPVEVNISYIYLDRDYILTVVRDITDRKQAETEREHLLAQIQEQAQQVQNIVDTVPEGVILLSNNQFVTLANPVARHYLTLLAPEFQNGRLIQLGQRSLNELLTSPPKGLWHEITTDELVFEAITRPVENGPDNGGWVLVLRDITQERDIQQRVQRQERLAAVGQLAAGIAHDFNNILAVIALYTQLISRTVEMPTHIQERLHTIEQQIKRATDLIQQILDFSRQSVLERQPVDLLPFMENLVALLVRTLPENIRVKLEHVGEAYFIQADPSRIQQVVMNLAVNARDAMPDGGHLKIGLVHVQTEKPQPMPVQDLPPGNWVQIEVTDSGEGIPQEALSHIFEPFFTTKEVGEGTGLGLAQVYGIVQQHEGYIDITTEVGQGTTFFLYFPALNIGAGTAELPERGTLQSGQGQKILLVEDDRATREALLDSLAQLNYEVLAATNGREALTILAAKADEIDLVLSDVVMPEMGGAALFHAMREQNLAIPIVLLTGHPLSKEMENLQALGLAGWLPKPPDLTNLSYLLAKALTV